MTNFEKAEELKNKDNFSMRSCWECNPAHNHLKTVGGLFICLDCNRWYMNGGYFDNEDHCNADHLDKAEELKEGEIYGQTISGTLFKQKILKDLGVLIHKKQYKVQNIETGSICILSEDDLHTL